MFTLSAFADEIDPDPQKQIDVLKQCCIRHIELRSILKTNVLDLTDLQIQELKSLLDKHGFKLSAIGSPIGKVVIGTVKGDIHDIGKNLVSMMLEGAGFEVIDLGINNPVEKYLAALEEHKPDILGMSALLTTTMPYMKVVIDKMKETGIRQDYIVLVGGAPLNEEFGKAVGADAYCRDAAIAVETAKSLVAKRRAAAGGARAVTA